MKPAVKAALGVLAVALPAGFNYLSARAEANEAKVRAEVAYTTMVEQVKGLQETVHDLELDHAEMKGKIYELERVKAVRMGEATPTHPEARAPKMYAAPAPFEEAVQTYKNAAKK